MLEVKIDLHQLVRASVYIAAYLGLAHMVTDVWAFGSNPAGVWGGVFNDLFTTGIAVTLLLGLNVIVESLSRGESASLDDAPSSQGWWGRVQASLDNPALLFKIGLPIVPLFGMIHLVLAVWSRRNGAPSDIWANLLFNAFSVVAVIGFFVAAKAVVDWFENRGQLKHIEAAETKDWRVEVGRLLDQPLPLLTILINLTAFLGLLLTLVQLVASRNVSASPTWSIITGNLFLTLGAVGFLVAARTIIRGFDKRGDLTDPVSIGLPQRFSGLESQLTTPSSFLRLTAYALAYLGVINLILDVLSLRNAAASTLWRFVLTDVLFTVSAVGFMIGAKAIADWFTARIKAHGSVTIAAVEAASGEWIESRRVLADEGAGGRSSINGGLINSLANPRLLLYAGAFVAAAVGALYLIVTLLSLNSAPFSVYLYFVINTFSQSAAAVFVLVVLVAIIDSLKIGKPEIDISEQYE